MKLVAYKAGQAPELGVLSADGSRVAAVSEIVPGFTGDLVALIERWDALRPRLEAAEPTKPLPEGGLLAPIPRPRRNILCVGKNYYAHAQEFGTSGYDASATAAEAIPERPVVFTKAPGTVVGPGGLIERHPGATDELDYEVELAVIIGRGGRAISPDAAYSHVWGYTIVNDVTARDVQRAHKQWFLGKSMDTFCPMGPWAVSAEEVEPEDLQVECWVNGELRQSANTRDLIFDIPTIIATISAGMTLAPGDIIATGTPAGVGIGFDPPRFLTSGDEVTMRITGLGTLSNRVA